MTLDKAIKCYEEAADYDCYSEKQIKFAEEYRQIAEWLRELKAYREREWIPCSERLPDCEQEVLICAEKKPLGLNAYIDQIVTPAIYEDGTMPECDSMWSWIDVDFDAWDQENDCGIVPEGWWENRHFNPDGEYNNIIDRKVVAWMPLPEPWGGEKE